MERRRVRLGDVLDDYCTRCRLIMNHGIVGMVGDEVRKVRCNTCMTEHLFKHGKVPAKKRRENARLFEEVLRGLGRTPDSEAGAVEDETPEDDAAAAAPSDPETALEDEAPGIAADSAEAAALPAAPPAQEGDAERPADEIHGVRRKLYTIRRFSGGKAPAGSEGADTTGGRPPAAHVTGAGHRAGPRGQQQGGGARGGARGGGQGGGHGGGHAGGQGGGRPQGGRGSGGRSGGRRRYF